MKIDAKKTRKTLHTLIDGYSMDRISEALEKILSEHEEAETSAELLADYYACIM